MWTMNELSIHALKSRAHGRQKPINFCQKMFHEVSKKCIIKPIAVIV